MSVRLDSLKPADSSSIDGEQHWHISKLSHQIGLPPITVHRQSMRIIDGMHRIRAAELRGKECIAARFFDGSGEDAFVIAVKLNSDHGLPLSPTDRSAAALRIIESHPQWSDRPIAAGTGPAATTVAALRRRASRGRCVQLSKRVGRDGRSRPLRGPHKGVGRGDG
ncbi:ParB N-terminal domain-containing protein [Streptomyces sp. NPDC058092]|uniref:ParB N-terminal domain-containing protein n=1 Tax=Streptomyces sp. NPDC058092 TaxID=3346336 RepID=UPI0036EF4878